MSDTTTITAPGGSVFTVPRAYTPPGNSVTGDVNAILGGMNAAPAADTSAAPPPAPTPSPSSGPLDTTSGPPSGTNFNLPPPSSTGPSSGNGVVATSASQVGQTSDTINPFLSKTGQSLNARFANWCAAFVNGTLNANGIQGTSGPSKDVATSFLNWGSPVNGAPQAGDVLVQPRGHPMGGLGGHVGIATGQTTVGPGGQTFYQMISGNYGGRVAYSWEPASSVVARTASAGTDNNVMHFQVGQHSVDPSQPAIVTAHRPGAGSTTVANAQGFNLPVIASTDPTHPVNAQNPPAQNNQPGPPVLPPPPPGGVGGFDLSQVPGLSGLFGGQGQSVPGQGGTLADQFLNLARAYNKTSQV